MLGNLGEVYEFVRVGSVVVEVLRSVLVRDQSPVTGSYGMISKIGGGDGRMLSRRVRISELRDKGNSFEPIVFGQVAQLEQGGVEVQQAGGFLAFFARFDSRTADQKWNTRRFFPEGTLGPVLFLAEVKAMITPQNDDGVIGMGACLQGIQDNPHAMIYETDRGKVGVGQASLVATPRNLGMSRSHGIVIDGEKILGQVIEVALRVLGQDDLILLIELKPFGRYQKRNVRTKETDRHKERFVKVLLEGFGPASAS